MLITKLLSQLLHVLPSHGELTVTKHLNPSAIRFFSLQPLLFDILMTGLLHNDILSFLLSLYRSSFVLSYITSSCVLHRTVFMRFSRCGIVCCCCVSCKCVALLRINKVFWMWKVASLCFSLDKLFGIDAPISGSSEILLRAARQRRLRSQRRTGLQGWRPAPSSGRVFKESKSFISFSFLICLLGFHAKVAEVKAS